MKIIKRDYTYLDKNIQDQLRGYIKCYLLDNLDLMKNIVGKISKQTNYWPDRLPFKNSEKVANEFYSDLRHYGSAAMYSSLMNYSEEDEYCLTRCPYSITEYRSFNKEKYYEILKSRVNEMTEFIITHLHEVKLHNEIGEIWNEYKIDDVVLVEEPKYENVKECETISENRLSNDDYDDDGRFMRRMFGDDESSFDWCEGMSGLPSGLNVFGVRNTQISGGSYRYY